MLADLFEISAKCLLIHRSAYRYKLSARLAVKHDPASPQILADLRLMIKGRNGKLTQVGPAREIIRPNGIHTFTAAIGKNAESPNQSVLII